MPLVLRFPTYHRILRTLSRLSYRRRMGGQEESYASESNQPTDALPPYPEVSGMPSTSAARVPYRLGSVPCLADSKQNEQDVPAPINSDFPHHFFVYNASAFGRSYMLGEHRNVPIYSITTHTGLSGQPDVVLHSGPNGSSPPLAGVDYSAFSRSATVELPPSAGSGHAITREPLKFSGFWYGTYSFTIEVGQTGHRESFEWRHSHGAEVNSLGGPISGWKLMRLASGGGSNKEVVAVWASIRMSITKEFSFCFLGIGATGALGKRWAVMAVITALRIWRESTTTALMLTCHS